MIAADELILLADDQEVQLGRTSLAGRALKTFDENLSLRRSHQIEIRSLGIKRTVEIGTSGSSRVRVTLDQEFLTDKGWIVADDLFGEVKLARYALGYRAADLSSTEGMGIWWSDFGFYDFERDVEVCEVRVDGRTFIAGRHGFCLRGP